MRIRKASELPDDGAGRYQEYLQSYGWKRKREAIMQRDNYTCKRCGQPATETHHLRYRDWGSEWPEDLIALCRTCHEAIHQQ